MRLDEAWRPQPDQSGLKTCRALQNVEACAVGAAGHSCRKTRCAEADLMAAWAGLGGVSQADAVAPGLELGLWNKHEVHARVLSAVEQDPEQALELLRGQSVHRHAALQVRAATRGSDRAVSSMPARSLQS